MTNNFNQKNKVTLKALSGSIIAVIIAMISILIFAFIIKLTNLSDTLIKPINQIIKIVSIVFGVKFAVKRCNENPIILGLLTGVCFTLLAFIVFSLLNGGFTFDKSLLNDTVFGAIAGAICGIVFSKTSPAYN